MLMGSQIAPLHEGIHLVITSYNFFMISPTYSNPRSLVPLGYIDILIHDGKIDMWKDEKKT